MKKKMKQTNISEQTKQKAAEGHVAGSALELDRDKNKTYVANDEAVDEIVNDEGYQVIHPNREIEIKK